MRGHGRPGRFTPSAVLGRYVNHSPENLATKAALLVIAGVLLVLAIIAAVLAVAA